MSSELSSPELFQRHAMGLGLLSYDKDAQPQGIFQKHFIDKWTTSEKFVYGVYSDELVENLIERIVVLPTMDEAARDDARMPGMAASIRILHSRGVDLVQKAKAAVIATDYEGPLLQGCPSSSWSAASTSGRRSTQRTPRSTPRRGQGRARGGGCIT